MNYPIVIHKDKHSDYGVTVPDLPGCFSAGSTLDEAIDQARQSIELHIEGLIEDGQAIPRAGTIDRHRRNRAYAGGIWAIVNVDTSQLPLKTKRINITMPQRVLQAVDRQAEREGETRSGLLVRAATRYMAERSGKRTGR